MIWQPVRVGVNSFLNFFSNMLDQQSKLLNQFDGNRVSMMRQLLPLTAQVPHPASGKTLLRWQLLAQVAAVDLCLVKWYEAHLDALSIVHEIQALDAANGWWAIWAADGGPSPLNFQENWLNGEKLWCSAAAYVDYALITYRDAQRRACLVTVDMQSARALQQIIIDEDQWHAVGMAATHTAQLSFNHAKAEAVGAPDAYLNRAGFWHGAAGVAACWFGATLRLAQDLQLSYRHKPHDYKAMYLGDVLRIIEATRHQIYAVAHLIDEQPTETHQYAIRALRAQVEDCAEQVSKLVGKALGAAPFCQSEDFAIRMADLSVFIRQSHAAFDLQHIAQLSLEQDGLWQL